MNTQHGWAGKILRIDLSTGKISMQDSRNYVPKFLGGLGIGLKILWDEVPAEIGPFDPENRIVFAVGPLTGTYAPTNGRTIVISKSPQTYSIEQCTRGSFGGHWGAELKFAGYDALVIKGKAEEPVYISIANDKVLINKAKHLWGMDSFKSQRVMITEFGDPRAKTLAIGVGGEKLCRFASIIHETGSAAGQGGFGAVMGSKNLKGIIVRGTGKVSVANSPERIWKVYLNWRRLLPGALQSAVPIYENNDPNSQWRARPGLAWLGGPKVVEIGKVDPRDINRQGLRSHMSDWFSSQKLNPYHVKNVGCFGCPIECAAYVRMKSIRKLGLPESGRMQCGQYFYHFLNLNATAESIFAAKQMADIHTLNAFELMTMVNFVRWMNERGQPEFRDALPWESESQGGDGGLRFITRLIHMIAYREGIGDVLAEGVPRAAEHFKVIGDVLSGDNGGYKVNYCMHGMKHHYDPRVFSTSYGLQWLMDNRDPNRHVLTGLMPWSGLTFEQKQRVVEVLFGSKDIIDDNVNGPIRPHNRAKALFAKFALIEGGIIKDSLPVCDWVFPCLTSPLKEREYVGDLSLESQIFSAITGNRVSREELSFIGERIFNLHRAITVRDWETPDLRGGKGYKGSGKGYDRGGDFGGHDNFPEWYFRYPKEKQKVGNPLNREEYEKAKTDFYDLCQWDKKTGAPGRSVLEKYDLGDVADELEKRQLLPSENRERSEWNIEGEGFAYAL